jgi:tetratricopeptide (TPR) repeat protein
MKSLPLMALVVALAVLAGAGAGALVNSPRDDVANGTDVAVTRLIDRIDALVAENRSLRERVDSLALRANAPPSAAVSAAAIDAAVERYLEVRGDELAKSLAPDELAGEPAELDVEDAVARLLDPDTSDSEIEELWEALSKAGLTDAAIAIFEARARANPNDPELQNDLGLAYLRKIFEVGSGPQAGVWATKADNAFDAALALDDHNWDARFNKAVSLSFWPPIFGKQSDAIEHFNTLIGQQEGGPSEPQHAQTYVLLGNLYMQSGDSDKAFAAWQAGLGLFPDDEELLDKLGG